MRNNVIFRQLRYIFDFSDDQMIDLFAQAEVTVTRSEVSDWLKEEQEGYHTISNANFASFLNGFINHKRGKKEGPQPEPEKQINNNIILRKLKIALNLKDTDIIEIYKGVDIRVSKHEISAFFRKPDQKQYRACKDQFLRNFLHGLQVKYRPDETKTIRENGLIYDTSLSIYRSSLVMSKTTEYLETSQVIITPIISNSKFSFPSIPSSYTLEVCSLLTETLIETLRVLKTRRVSIVNSMVTY